MLSERTTTIGAVLPVIQIKVFHIINADVTTIPETDNQTAVIKDNSSVLDIKLPCTIVIIPPEYGFI